MKQSNNPQSSEWFRFVRSQIGQIGQIGREEQNSISVNSSKKYLKNERNMWAITHT